MDRINYYRSTSVLWKWFRVSMVIYAMAAVLSLFSTFGFWLSVISFVPVCITFLFWLHRASSNLWSLGRDQRNSPLAAVLWWFVPVANWFVPYFVLRELSQESDPHSQVSKLLGFYWVLWIGSGILLAGSVSFGWYTIAVIVELLAGALLVMLSQSVTQNQEASIRKLRVVSG